MHNFLKAKKNYLIILGVIINISFFISAFSTGWYDYFFFGSSIHYCCRGLDFFAVPNGAYSFYHGGDFSGRMPYSLPPYSIGFPSNLNLYHPFFTLFLGSFFLLFQPNIAFYLWMGIKFIYTMLVAYYLHKTFSHSKALPLALFVFLANFAQYNEIKISQYQFIFNIFLLLFLVALVKKQHIVAPIIYFLITLLVKPLGLLWLPTLLIKRRFRLAIISVLLFIVLTLPFIINRTGMYYVDNLTSVFFHPIYTNTIDIMSLDAFLRSAFNITPHTITILKALSILIISLLAFSKRISLFKCIFFLVVYFLCFYDLLYQYHFSILGPVFTVGLLSDRDFRTLPAKILILISTGPTIFFLLRFFNYDFIWDRLLGPNPTITGWQLVSFFQLLPILLLVIVVFFRPVKEIILDIKTLVPAPENLYNKS